MLGESLPEYVHLAALGIGTVKENGGVLGFPSALLLMAVVDAIGAYHRGSELEIEVDGCRRRIRSTQDHFLILNSMHFRYGLTDQQIGRIYEVCRSPLTHLAVIGEDMVLVGAYQTPPPGSWTGRAIVFTGPRRFILFLPQLLQDCIEAVDQFLAGASEIVPASRAVAELRMKGARAAAARVPNQ